MSTQDDHPIDDLEKPSKEYEPEDVVELQVEALGNNDDPREDAGIETAYNFASPSNRASTGPIDRFKRMVKNRLYSDMIDHEKASYTPMVKNGDRASQEVVLAQEDGSETKYEFVVSLQDEGEFEGCWMTDSVRKI